MFVFINRSLPGEVVEKKSSQELHLRGISVRLFALDRCIFVCWPEEETEFGMRVYKLCCENYGE